MSAHEGSRWQEHHEATALKDQQAGLQGHGQRAYEVAKGVDRAPLSERLRDVIGGAVERERMVHFVGSKDGVITIGPYAAAPCSVKLAVFAAGDFGPWRLSGEVASPDIDQVTCIRCLRELARKR